MNKQDPFVRFILALTIYGTITAIVVSTIIFLSAPDPIASCAMLGGCK
jgi:hypothetical protein